MGSQHSAVDMGPAEGKNRSNTVFLDCNISEHEDMCEAAIPQVKKATDLEVVLQRCVGKYGFFQYWLFLVMFFCQATMAPGVYGAIFTDYTPKHYCGHHDEEEFNMSVWEAMEDKCGNITSGGQNCTSWVYDKSVFQSTASSDFDIVCDKASLKTISATLRMSGLLIGSFFFGWFSDLYGRVPSITAAGLLLLITQTLNGFSTNYIMFSILNIFMAAGGVGTYLVSFVLLFEWCCPEYRTKVSVFAQVPFAVGFLYVVFISWCIRSSWRTLQWVIAGPNLIFLVIPFFVPESPRWLVSRGRCEDAITSIAKAAKSNKLQGPQNLVINEVVEGEGEGISALVQYPTLLFRLFIMSLNWVVITLLFYGLSMNSASKDLFIGMSTMAAIELVGYFATMVFMDSLGRQPILSICQILAGISCIGAGLVPVSHYWPRLCLALVGKAGTSAGFAVVFVYTAEMFPTAIRNSAVGLCSTAARIGAIGAPFIAGLDSFWEPLPFLIMGGSAVVVGCLSCLLPETRGSTLPETVEDALALSTKLPCYKNNKKLGQEEGLSLN